MSERKLKAYMLCSHGAGSQEGAVLCFHHTAKEAKKLAWQYGDLVDIIQSKYIYLMMFTDDKCS